MPVFLAAGYNAVLFLVMLQTFTINGCFGEWEPWYELKKILAL